MKELQHKFNTIITNKIPYNPHDFWKLTCDIYGTKVMLEMDSIFNELWSVRNINRDIFQIIRNEIIKKQIGML